MQFLLYFLNFYRRTSIFIDINFNICEYGISAIENKKDCLQLENRTLK